jgi:hypothetical protein
MPMTRFREIPSILLAKLRKNNQFALGPGLCHSKPMKFSRLLQLALSLALLSILGVPASGQFPRVGISGSIPIGKLETMDDALQIADPAAKSDLLKRLGIDANVAEAVAAPSFSHDIEIQPLHTHSGKLYGIISLPCGIQGQASLYLLDGASTNDWHIVDGVALNCFHETPTFRLLSLIPGEDFVFVQHAHLGHGSGEVEDKASIYIIRKGRMHEVLSTVDYLSRQEPTYSSPPIEQNSFFLQISRRIIEETRITSQNGFPLRAERRIWKWRTTQAVFSPPTSFHTIGSESK